MTDPGAESTSATVREPRPVGPWRDRRILVVVGMVVAVGLVLLVGLVAARSRTHVYAGTVLDGDQRAPSLAELSYADGTPVDLAANRGQVVLVFFGYTNCPDICPTTMADAAGALDRLDEDDADRTNLVMVSVDPERDGIGAVDEYVGFFDPTFRGAGGPTEAIDRAASAFGVFYQLGRPDADGGYLVDHTSTLMGIDPDGTVRVIWASGVGPEALAADIEALLS